MINKCSPRHKSVPRTPRLLGLMLIGMLPILIFHGKSTAEQLRYYTPRSSIKLPNDCAFVAHSGPYRTIADTCARMLLRLDKALKSSWLNKECDIEEFHDLQYVTAGESMHDFLEFLPLGNGKFLIKLVCSFGAYNSHSLIFAYDESHVQRQKFDDSGSRSLPSLIVFPRLHAAYAPSGFSYEVNVRDFEETNAILYHFDKYLGDGSGGIYAEYEINKKTFIPTLRRSVHKDSANYEEKYEFERGRLPKGRDWLIDDVRNVPHGCLLPLAPNSLPKTEPAVSCWGQSAVIQE